MSVELSVRNGNGNMSCTSCEAAAGAAAGRQEEGTEEVHHSKQKANVTLAISGSTKPRAWALVFFINTLQI